MNGQDVNSPLLGSSKPTLKNYSTAPDVGYDGGLRSRIRESYKFKSLFAVKPIEAFLAEREARPEGHRLAERLGLSDLLGYGVGCTVGAGIYSLIGIGVGIAGHLSLTHVRPDNQTPPL